MLQLLRESKTYDVAFSGGVDSTCALMYTRKFINRDAKALYFNHGDEYAHTTEEPHVVEFCKQHNVPLIIERNTVPMIPGDSLEAYWRHWRYKFLMQHSNDVATGHHLDDVAETYLFTTLHGVSKIISLRNGNIVRPFMLNRKYELESWCSKQGLNWLRDTNEAVAHRPRAKVREVLVPAAVEVHHGFMTTVRNMVRNKYQHAV